MSETYERRADYWTRDLADRSFEELIKDQLDTLGWPFKDQTESHNRPDFLFRLPLRNKPVKVALEAKEKRQHYRQGWVQEVDFPEELLLVQDEVSARKLLVHAPRAFLLFWDHTVEMDPFVCFTIIDLFCQPRVRIERPINRQTRRVKAKWLLDRRNGRAFQHLRDVFAFINTYLARDLGEEVRALQSHRPGAGESIACL
ncbi:MAG: hypothetical protein U9R25_19000 [Chloroflexota bacterium]|nr:hypothetical protein [Chloroflexota bacterium]